MSIIGKTYGVDIYDPVEIAAEDAAALVREAKQSEFQVHVRCQTDDDYDELCESLEEFTDDIYSGGDVRMPAFKSFQGDDWQIVVTAPRSDGG